MVRKLCAAIILLSLSVPLPAQESPRDNKWKRVWAWSAVALMASASADVASSLGGQELNPVMRGPGGRFGARGVTIKFSVAGAMVASQWWMLRKRPDQAPYMATANIAASALTSSVTWRNARSY